MTGTIIIRLLTGSEICQDYAMHHWRFKQMGRSTYHVPNRKSHGPTHSPSAPCFTFIKATGWKS